MSRDRQAAAPWNHAKGEHNPTYAVVVAGGSKDAPDKALFDRASLWLLIQVVSF